LSRETQRERERERERERMVSTESNDGHDTTPFSDEVKRSSSERENGRRRKIAGERTRTTTYSLFPHITDYSIYEPCHMILNSGTHAT